MPKRTTIEIDEELLARAKRALGHATTRATVEDALRRAADSAEGERADRAERQAEYLTALGDHADLAILETEEMWRSGSTPRDLASPADLQPHRRTTG